MEVALLLLRIAIIILLYAFLGLIVILLWRDVRSAALRESAPADRVRPARLVVIKGVDASESGAAYPLKAITSIGRAPTNLIELADTYCSAEHAWVLWRNGQWWLEDRGSRNGTLLNGDMVDTPVILSAGDVIRIGHAHLHFEVDASN